MRYFTDLLATGRLGLYDPVHIGHRGSAMAIRSTEIPRGVKRDRRVHRIHESGNRFCLWVSRNPTKRLRNVPCFCLYGKHEHRLHS